MVQPISLSIRTSRGKILINGWRVSCRARGSIVPCNIANSLEIESNGQSITRSRSDLSLRLIAKTAAAAKPYLVSRCKWCLIDLITVRGFMLGEREPAAASPEGILSRVYNSFPLSPPIVMNELLTLFLRWESKLFPSTLPLPPPPLFTEQARLDWNETLRR